MGAHAAHGTRVGAMGPHGAHGAPGDYNGLPADAAAPININKNLDLIKYGFSQKFVKIGFWVGCGPILDSDSNSA